MRPILLTSVHALGLKTKVSLCNRKAGRKSWQNVCVTIVTALSLACFVVTSLNITVFWSCTKSILFHNTQSLALIVIKVWENLTRALEEVENVIDYRSKHEFLAKKGLGRVVRSTFLLGANQRLSGEGVFNGI